jgi:hypothetical protein
MSSLIVAIIDASSLIEGRCAHHRQVPSSMNATLLPQPGGFEGLGYSIANCSSCPSL